MKIRTINKILYVVIAIATMTGASLAGVYIYQNSIKQERGIKKSDQKTQLAAVETVKIKKQTKDETKQGVDEEGVLREEEFSPESYDENLAWFNNNFLPLLDTYDDIIYEWSKEQSEKSGKPVVVTETQINKLRSLPEVRTLGLVNFETELEGFELREEAKIAELEYELLICKKNAGVPITAGEMDTVKQRNDVLKQKFQQFLQHRGWTD